MTSLSSVGHFPWPHGELQVGHGGPVGRKLRGGQTPGGYVSRTSEQKFTSDCGAKPLTSRAVESAETPVHLGFAFMKTEEIATLSYRPLEITLTVTIAPLQIALSPGGGWGVGGGGEREGWGRVCRHSARPHATTGNCSLPAGCSKYTVGYHARRN